MLRNVLAVVAGLTLGSLLNMALVTVSSSLIPPPEGADMTTVEGLKAAMPSLEAKHFFFPFLAHALGTLVASFVAVKIASVQTSWRSRLSSVCCFCWAASPLP
jgi:hypothetical protein